MARDKENSNDKDSRRTMCIDNRSPNHSQFGAAHLFTRTVDKCTALPEIKSASAVSVQGNSTSLKMKREVLCGFRVIDAFELKETGVAN